MTKISGILPSSPRIEAVDMKQERPLRPGTMSFGQPVARATQRNSVAHKETVSAINDEIFNKDLNSAGRKSDEDIVVELSSAFFMKPKPTVEKAQDVEETQRLDVWA